MQETVWAAVGGSGENLPSPIAPNTLGLFTWHLFLACPACLHGASRRGKETGRGRERLRDRQTGMGPGHG